MNNDRIKIYKEKKEAIKKFKEFCEFEETQWKKNKMREIKFRGLGQNGWEYGYLTYEQFCGWDAVHHSECDNKEYLIYSKESKDVISYGYKIHRSGHQSSIWVKHKTVGQYINLKDKNCKEIYNGDIVKYKYSEETSLSEPFYLKYIVEWSDLNNWWCFVQPRKKDGNVLDGICTGGMAGQELNRYFKIEVIGNIYENLKLLKEKEKMKIYKCPICNLIKEKCCCRCRPYDCKSIGKYRLSEKGARMNKITKGMVTWRTNSAIHYIDEKRNPLCGAKKIYSQVWEVPYVSIVTCSKCRRKKVRE